jgi:hypothetical protein
MLAFIAIRVDAVVTKWIDRQTLLAVAALRVDDVLPKWFNLKS